MEHLLLLEFLRELAQQGRRAIFQLGGLYQTPGVAAEVHWREAAFALYRHATGDWGDLGNHDRRENELALKFGGRLFSAYHTRGGRKFWIITECDRSATTLLLPEEY
jgi:hypothetical protein